MSLIYLHDGSFEGFCTAVFEAYARRPAPDAIDELGCQQTFGASYREIPTDDALADRVIEGVTRRAGSLVYERLWTAFLSDDPQKSQKLFRFLQLAMRTGPSVLQRLQDDRVHDVEKLVGPVGREAGLLIEFVRFSRLEGGVWYARIDPQYPVLPMIMPHFAERFSIQPFLIHDAAHSEVAVYDTHGWKIVRDADLSLPGPTEEEYEFRRLWKQFYDTAAIRERINPRLRMNHMPKKFWRNMTEFQPEPARRNAAEPPPPDRERPALADRPTAEPEA